MRPLIIDEEIKAKASEVLDYATRHVYRPTIRNGELDPASPDPPGEDPQHVLMVPHNYRCVFSFTEIAHEGRYRDLSVSIPTAHKSPNPFAVLTIATELFGFTGWDGKTLNPLPDGWMIAPDLDGHAIRVVQRMES